MMLMIAQRVARIMTNTLSGVLAIALTAATATPALAQAHGTWTTPGDRGNGDKEGIDFYTTTLLQNGQVLVAGGSNPGTGKVYAKALLYNPATGWWANTGSMSTPRQGHTATPLANGEVLVTGGSPRMPLSPVVDILDTAELCNPSTGTWTTTGNMTMAREDHNAVLLQNGEVLVEGGSSYTGCGLGCEQIEPHRRRRAL
jgi:hypothetical protein